MSEENPAPAGSVGVSIAIVGSSVSGHQQCPHAPDLRTEVRAVGRVTAHRRAGPFDLGPCERSVSDLVESGWSIAQEVDGLVHLVRPLDLRHVLTGGEGICCPHCNRVAWRNGRCEADDWRATAPCLHRDSEDAAYLHHVAVVRALLGEP